MDGHFGRQSSAGFLAGGKVIKKGDMFNTGLGDLGEGGIDTGVGGEADDLHAVGQGAGDFEGGGADGPGGAEQEDAFFGGDGHGEGKGAFLKTEHEPTPGSERDDGEVKVEDGGGEEKGIGEVEDAADARQSMAGVFDVSATLDDGLGEVT
jgi:hypothetical protein